MNNKSAFAQFFLRLALGIDFLVPGLDRLGVWGGYGSPNVSWGDWEHFSRYARETMGFLPAGFADMLAVLATVWEIAFGTLLIIGLFTRLAAAGSAMLTFCFALSMSISFGVMSPINYSVFVVSAGSFLLATMGTYRWSIDESILKHKKIKPLT
jgi:uncharacterized membrane protein YphA (DoxX/SURF4 family)